ncbi:SH3 domain-containing protein [Roseibium hamelinense]|uniref:SH3 domain-containing protein n=1 Tax=Roseibium hamelinense TaxID=150831 RepID=A0A562T7Y1_9HYPH|nr:SH3 domain-containing protein [Roseibium hamelinense]TWI89672.1 SH3 domain-containing protein [Roseibium hamelinense]
MYRRLSLFVTALALFAIPANASAASYPAVSTANVNIRTGPGTSYQVISTIPQGAGLQVYSCTANYAWCDASFSGMRGWVSGNYITYAARGQYYGRPVTAVGIYVGVPRIYRNYPIYRSGPRVFAPPPRAVAPLPPRAVYPLPPRAHRPHAGRPPAAHAPRAHQPRAHQPRGPNQGPPRGNGPHH